MGLTELTSGISFHRSSDRASLSAIWVTGDVSPDRVGRTPSMLKYAAPLRPLSLSRTTGSTSPTGVPAQPPSANERRPPSISRPPPRLLVKLAIIRSFSGENEGASRLPRIGDR